MSSAIQPHASPSAFRNRPAASGKLLEHVVTALDALNRRWEYRSAAATRACSCSECRAIRSQPFTCSTCGFEGTPYVFPCVCPEEDRRGRADTLRTLQRLRKDPELRAEMEAKWREQGHLQPNETIIDRFERIAAPRPVRTKCPTAKPHCAHGGVECPVCGDPGDGQVNEGIQVWHLVRDARAELRALAGLLS